MASATPDEAKGMHRVPPCRRRQGLTEVHTKLALTAIFALGFFVTVIQVIRIFTISRLRNYADSQPIVIWSIVEISLAVCRHPC